MAKCKVQIQIFVLILRCERHKHLFAYFWIGGGSSLLIALVLLSLEFWTVNRLDLVNVFRVHFSSAYKQIMDCYLFTYTAFKFIAIEIQVDESNTIIRQLWMLI